MYFCLYCGVPFPTAMMRPSDYIPGHMMCNDHDACMLRIHQRYHTSVNPCEDCSHCTLSETAIALT